MNATPLDLLKRLSSSGAPAASGMAPAKSADPSNLQTLGFAELLGKAKAGEFSTSLPVAIDQKVGVQLSDEQLARLAKAADRAESEGFATAIVHLDGQHLKLDVQARRVTGRVDASTPVASGIDGVVFADPAPGSAEAAAAEQALVTGSKLLGVLNRPSPFATTPVDASSAPPGTPSTPPPIAKPGAAA